MYNFAHCARSGDINSIRFSPVILSEFRYAVSGGGSTAPCGGLGSRLKTLEAPLAAKPQGTEPERLADIFGALSEAGTRWCEAPRRRSMRMSPGRWSLP